LSAGPPASHVIRQDALGTRIRARIRIHSGLARGELAMAETPNAERKGTRVTFLDQTGAKSVDAVIADPVTVKRILPNIITKMNLPVMGPDGQPMSYSLDHKEGGKRLREDQTLIDAMVKDGDHLIVYPEIVAG
jgi:hypothetical protein